MHKSPFKIVAGGQTGADRAALDWAIAQGVRHGGWCPKGRRAEDGIIPRRYRLKETRSPAYHVRTRRNVRESDGTLIISVNQRIVGGTKRTRRVRRDLEETVAAFDNDDRHPTGSPATGPFHRAAPHRCAQRCWAAGFRGARDSSLRAGHIDEEPSACSRPSTEMNRCPACLRVTGRWCSGINSLSPSPRMRSTDLLRNNWFSIGAGCGGYCSIASKETLRILYSRQSL